MGKTIIGVLALCAVSFWVGAQSTINPLENKAPGSLVPAWRIKDVTPTNSCDPQGGFGVNVRAIYVGSGGNIRVTTEGGDTVTIVGAVTGSVLPIQVKCIYSTSTTASSLQVWW